MTFSSSNKVVDNFGNIEECPSTFDSSLPPGGDNGCWDKTGTNDEGENICSVPMASECLAMVFFYFEILNDQKFLTYELFRNVPKTQ